MKQSSQRFQLLLLAILFLLSSIIISQSGLFSRLRIDLTENNLFTLSQGTKNIIQNIDEQVHIRLFFSEQAAHDLPMLKTYHQRVKDFLEELARYSGHKLKISYIDPISFSEEEDRASQYGLQALPVGEGGENVFFGIAATNALDDIEILTFLQPERESYLEYDLAELIYNLNNPNKPTVGVLTELPMITKPNQMVNETSNRGQIIFSQLQEMYQVKLISGNSLDFGELDLLVVIHPQQLTEETLFAIDQFVMGGGRLLVFVDPLNQSQEVLADPENPMAQIQADRSSDFALLFAAWGIQYDPTKVVLDNHAALSIQSPQGQTLRHLGINAWNNNNLSDDIVNLDLSQINTALAGYFVADKAQLTPLITTNKDSMVTSVDPFSMLLNPTMLFQNYQADNNTYVIAGRIDSAINTAFPNGISNQSGEEVIMKQARPRIVVVADVDMLYDRLWVQAQNFFGRNVFSPFADNGNFINNVMDHLTGSENLIQVRARGTSNRPFNKVLAIQRDSEKRYRDTENQLRQQLRETEIKLNELQQVKGQENQLIISAEQQQEIEKFKQRKLAVRKSLREVKRNLNKDIEELGNRIKLINIVLIPVLITLLMVLISWFRVQRKGQDYDKNK